MNRRNFITKALAGLATLTTLPLLSRLADARDHRPPVQFPEASKDWPPLTHGFYWSAEHGSHVFVDGKEVFPDQSGYYCLAIRNERAL